MERGGGYKVFMAHFLSFYRAYRHSKYSQDQVLFQAQNDVIWDKQNSA